MVFLNNMSPGFTCINNSLLEQFQNKIFNIFQNADIPSSSPLPPLSTTVCIWLPLLPSSLMQNPLWMAPKNDKLLGHGFMTGDPIDCVSHENLSWPRKNTFTKINLMKMRHLFLWQAMSGSIILLRHKWFFSTS